MSPDSMYVAQSSRNQFACFSFLRRDRIALMTSVSFYLTSSILVAIGTDWQPLPI
jgi:hypothetical protein